MAMSLMTYHVLVRKTWLGEFLDGQQRNRKPVMPELESGENLYPAVAPSYANADRSLTRSVQRAVHRIPHGG